MPIDDAMGILAEMLKHSLLIPYQREAVKTILEDYYGIKEGEND